MRYYRELLIERSAELEKGVIAWDKIESIELQRQAGQEGGFLVVNVKPEWNWRGSNVVEFGHLTDNCWDEIRTRYGNDLQFVESIEE